MGNPLEEALERARKRNAAEQPWAKVGKALVVTTAIMVAFLFDGVALRVMWNWVAEPRGWSTLTDATAVVSIVMFRHASLTPSSKREELEAIDYVAKCFGRMVFACLLVGFAWCVLRWMP